MSWNWDASSWRRSTKLLLGFATIWPIVYMVLFMGIVISLVVMSERNRNPCGEIDILQLDRKIRDGEIKKLTIGSGALTADDTQGCKYHVFIRDNRSRNEILMEAREVVNGKPRVNEVVEETSDATDFPSPFGAIAPVAFLVLFVLHMATILLMTAQMPFYIVLAVKNAQLGETIRIVWIVVFAVLSIFAAPVYWYVYIWRKQKASTDSDVSSIGLNPPTSN